MNAIILMITMEKYQFNASFYQFTKFHFFSIFIHFKRYGSDR